MLKRFKFTQKTISLLLVVSLLLSMGGIGVYAEDGLSQGLNPVSIAAETEEPASELPVPEAEEPPSAEEPATEPPDIQAEEEPVMASAAADFDAGDMYIESAEMLYEPGTDGAFTAAIEQLKRGLTEEQVKYMYANYRKTMVSDPDHSKADQFRIGQGDIYKLADPNVYYTYLRNISLCEGRIFNIKARIPVGTFTGIAGDVDPGATPFNPRLIELWYGTTDDLTPGSGQFNKPLGDDIDAWTANDFNFTNGTGNISEIENIDAEIEGEDIVLDIRLKFFNMDQDQQNVNTAGTGYTTSGNGGASNERRTNLVNDLRRGNAKVRLYYDADTTPRVSMPLDLRMRDYQYTTLELQDYLYDNKDNFSEFIEADGRKTVGDGSFGFAGSDRFIRVESLGKTPGIYTGAAPYAEQPNGPNDIWVGMISDSQESLDTYINEIVPMMNTNPEGVRAKFGSDIRLPIVYTNIHTPESAGADAPIHLFNLVAKEENIKYERAKEILHQGPWLDPSLPENAGSASASNMGCRWAGGAFLDHFQMIQYGRLGAQAGDSNLVTNPLNTPLFEDKDHYMSFWNVMDPIQGSELTTLDIDEMLEHYIFIFFFTQNPDGRSVGGVRAASYGMDPNRDGLYHTLPESVIGKTFLAEWEPVYLVEYHCTGYPFLIDPCTAPHDPCLEFDLISPRAHKLAESVTAALTGSGVQPRVLSCDENMDHGDDYDDASPIYSPGFSNHYGAIAQTIEAEGLHARQVLSCMYVAYGSMYDLNERWDDFLGFKIEYKRRGVVNENTDAKVNPFLFVASPNADIEWTMPGNTWGTYATTPPWTWAQEGDSWSADGRVVERRSALTSQRLPRVTPSEGVGFFPQYYVLPMNSEDQLDVSSAKAALEYLTRVQARVERLTVDTEVDGRLYKKGALVIDMRQGNRDIVNTVLNVGAIELTPSPVSLYAECVHSFGVFRGFTVDRIDVANAFRGKTEALNYTAVSADAKVIKNWKDLPKWYSLESKLEGGGETVIVKNNTVSAVKAVIEALKDGKAVNMVTTDAPGYGVRGDFVMTKTVFDQLKNTYYLEGTAVSSLDDGYYTALHKPVIQINGNEGENRHSFEALGLERGTDFIYNTTATATESRTVLVGFNNITAATYTDALSEDIGVISVGTSQSAVGPLMNPLTGAGYSAITLGRSTEAVLKAEINTNSTITANMDLVEYLATSYGDTGAITQLPEGAVPLLTSLNDEHIPEADRYKSGDNRDSFFRAGWAGVPNDDVPVNDRVKAKFADKVFVAAGTYGGDPEKAPIVVFTPNIFFRGANHFMGQRMLGNAILTLSAGIQPNNPDEESPHAALYEEITAAEELLLNTSISVNGSSVPKDKDWVTQAAYDAYRAAIDTAKAFILNNADPDNSEITAAVAALSKATKDFEDATAPGTERSGSGSRTTSTDPQQEPTPVANTFTDVKNSDWFYEYVMYAYDKGLMVGTSTSPMAFSPNTPTTRGMIVTILYRLAGSPDVNGLSNSFSDVANGTWYADAVKWAAANGIVSGYGGGKFGPQDNITRQDLATILNRYAQFASMDMSETREYTAFNDDARIAAYAKESVERFFKAGIVNGKPGNVYDPKGNATRAEVATMLMKLLETT